MPLLHISRPPLGSFQVEQTKHCCRKLLLRRVWPETLVILPACSVPKWPFMATPPSTAGPSYETTSANVFNGKQSQIMIMSKSSTDSCVAEPDGATAP